MSRSHKHLPHKSDFAARLQSEFNRWIAIQGQSLTRQQANAILGVVVDCLADAIVNNSGFELRGFAVAEVKEGSPRLKRNPHTGQVLRDEDGMPQTYTRRRVAVTISSVIDRALQKGNRR